MQPGKVKYEFRPYLIIGPDSKPAMRAVLAAGEQDRFWNFLQLFYLNQGGENSGYVTDSFLTGIAKGAGVPDIDKWNDVPQRLEVGRGDPAGQLARPSPSASRARRRSSSRARTARRPLGGFTIPTLQQIQAAIQQVS